MSDSDTSGIDHQSGIVRVDRPNEAPVAGPGIDFHFDEARAHAFVCRSSFAARGAAARLPDQAIVGPGQRGERRALPGIFGRGDDAVTHLKLGSIDLQNIGGAREQILSQFVGCGADGRSLQRDGAAAEPFIAQRREIRIAPNQADLVARRESQHLGDHRRQRRGRVGAAVGKRDLHGHVAIGG